MRQLDIRTDADGCVRVTDASTGEPIAGIRHLELSASARHPAPTLLIYLDAAQHRIDLSGVRVTVQPMPPVLHTGPDNDD